MWESFRNPEEGKEFISALIKGAQTLTDGACKGVFYWAPEADAEGGYKLGAFSKGCPTVIMDAFREAGSMKNKGEE